MKFSKITLGEILSEIEELPSSWMDDTARALVDSIDETLAGLGKEKPSSDQLKEAFQRQTHCCPII